MLSICIVRKHCFHVLERRKNKMVWVISGIISALISAVLFTNIKKPDNKKNMQRIRCLPIPFVSYLISDIIMISFIHKNNELFDAVSIVVLVNIMVILAVIDIKNKLIPNKYIFTMLLVRILSSAIYGVFSGRFVKYIINLSAGAVTGFIVLGIIALVSRKNLGAGDIKMFTMIGAFAGVTGVMDILIYSSVFCAVTGLILIASKKCTVKSSLPMAPFACAGTILYIILGCV